MRCLRGAELWWSACFFVQHHMQPLAEHVYVLSVFGSVKHNEVDVHCMVQDLLDLSKGSPSRSPLTSPTLSRGHGGTTPRVATQLNWFRGNSISCLNGSQSAIRLRKVIFTPQFSLLSPLAYAGICWVFVLRVFNCSCTALSLIVDACGISIDGSYSGIDLA